MEPLQKRHQWWLAPGRKAMVSLAMLLVLPGIFGCAGPKRLPPLDGIPLHGDDGPTLPVVLGVGLDENRASVEISLAGACFLKDGDGGGILARLEVNPGAGLLVCRFDGGRIHWSMDGRSGDTTSLVVQSVDPRQQLTYGDHSYRGDFLLISSPIGAPGLTLINTVELEDYLCGVVPWEIGRHPREFMAALQAQAVAARTYTVSHLGARRDRGFDVFASVMDQVYRGADGEHDLCNEAVAATAGQVLRWQGAEIEAYYSACCGGHSSRVDAVWPKSPQPYLVEHYDGNPQPDGRFDLDDAYCAGSRHSHWQETWSADELEGILQTTLPRYLDYMSQGSRGIWAGPLFSPRAGGVDPSRPGRLIDLEIVHRTPSGRIAQLTVTADAGTYHVRGDRVRWVMPPLGGNPTILRSALFDLDLQWGSAGLVSVTANGRGFGHGIGLCQIGALEMAKRGHDYPEILSHYYRGALLTRIGSR